MGDDGVRDRLRKTLAIDSERGACRHATRFGSAHDQRAETSHLFLEKTDRVIQFVAAKRITADEFGELIGFVNGGWPHWPHFVQRDRNASRCHLPGGFASGETA